MKPDALTWQELDMLDKVHMQLMRKVLGQGNSVVRPDGTRHQIDNKAVRKAFETHSVGSILRKRRLDWVLNVIRHPEENRIRH